MTEPEVPPAEMRDHMHEAWLETLDPEACLVRLRTEQVGRLAVFSDGFPVVLPVNYRLAEVDGLTWVVLRTRPGNVIDQASIKVAFEIDGIDEIHHRGWSVLVRGTLQRVDPDAADFRVRFDSVPWLTADRDVWLIIEPFSITGRMLHPAEPSWPFSIAAYL
jgi:nitroimidazol reductase NimA-like FMN-containing flavoprotein (pyridoxamine 5'-phosphate oxidase superfamily)